MLSRLHCLILSDETDLKYNMWSAPISEYVLFAIVAFTKLYASRPRDDFTPTFRATQVNSTALFALLRCEFWAVFTSLGSAVLVATLYDFAVTLKHAIYGSCCYFTADIYRCNANEDYIFFEAQRDFSPNNLSLNFVKYTQTNRFICSNYRRRPMC
jgi:hypothetical protein